MRLLSNSRLLLTLVALSYLCASCTARYCLNDVLTSNNPSWDSTNVPTGWTCENQSGRACATGDAYNTDLTIERTVSKWCWWGIFYCKCCDEIEVRGIPLWS